MMQVRDRVKELRRVPAAELRKNPRNWRKHGEAQTAALRAMLSEIGFAGALLARELPDGSLELIDGHLRTDLTADATVPVLVLDLTEAESHKLLLTFDPIAAMAEADTDALKSLMDEWKTDNPALQALFDHTAKEYDVLIGGGAPLEEPPAQTDKAMELQKKWQTALGQMWEAGKQRLLCQQWELSQWPMDSSYALLTDPPYGMNLDTDWSDVKGALGSIGQKNGTTGNRYHGVIGDDAPFDPLPLTTRFALAKQMFLFGADYYAPRLPNLDKGSWLVWDKRKESQAEAIGSEFELIWSQQKHKRRMLRHDWFGFLSSSNSADARNRFHPTQKPVSLIADIMQQWIEPNLVIYDPFCGSGTTLIAAHQLNRIGYGIEIDPGYVAVALERLSLLGLTPKLINGPTA